MTFSTGTDLLAFTVAYEATVEKAWWDVIIAALATPWNLPVYPSLDQAWGYTFLPTPQSSDYRKQSANPAGSSTFAGKQSQPLKVNNAAAAAAQFWPSQCQRPVRLGRLHPGNFRPGWTAA